MFENAFVCASSILDSLGVNMDFNKSAIISDIEETADLIAKSIRQIPNMKEMEDIKQLSIMQILQCISFPAYYAENPKLLASISLKMVELTLKHGISKYSCIGFSVFAIVLCRIGDNLSYKFGELSVDLSKKINSKELIPVVNLAFYAI